METDVQSPGQSVAILWMRFGPYHIARLRAAHGQLAAHGYGLHAIEVTKVDHYAWKMDQHAEPFRITALFDSRPYEQITRKEIHSRTASLLDELSPAAVAINGWSVPEARAALHWCRRNHRPAILFSETSEHDTDRIWWKEAIKRHLIRQFDAAIVGGEPHAQYAAKLGMPHDRIFKGYDVVDNDHFADGAASARTDAKSLRAELGLPDRYVYANTRFLPRKNIAGLLRAFSHYRQHVSAPWELIISGSGETEEAARALAVSLGIAGSVQWRGFVQYDELPTLYGLASVFIHPALIEPWGLVVNEACAAGLPILLSRTAGAASELLEGGTNGFAFDPASDEAIATALIRMHNLTDAQRRAMADASRRIVSAWTPDRFAAALLAALEQPPAS